MRHHFLAYYYYLKKNILFIFVPRLLRFFFNYLYYLFAVVWFRIKLVTALSKLAPLLHTRAT